MPQDKGFYLREGHPKMKEISCGRCIHWQERLYPGHTCETLLHELTIEDEHVQAICPHADFYCRFFERRVAVEKHCNNCKHWQRTDVAISVCWSGCSVRSHEHEVLMTRESHYCDKWEARP